MGITKNYLDSMQYTNSINFHQIPMILFTEIFFKSQNSHRIIKDLKESKAILNKMSNAGGIAILGFKLYYRARVTKIA
jgi:hypothetical protein